MEVLLQVHLPDCISVLLSHKIQHFRDGLTSRDMFFDILRGMCLTISPLQITLTANLWRGFLAP